MIFKNNLFQLTSNKEKLEVHNMLTRFDVQENLKGYHNEMKILKASDKKSLCKLGKIVQFINSCLTDPFFFSHFLYLSYLNGITSSRRQNNTKIYNTIFFADSKRRVQELFNDVSFVIFGHHTWDLEGAWNQMDPPSISWCVSSPAGIGLRVEFIL